MSSLVSWRHSRADTQRSIKAAVELLEGSDNELVDLLDAYSSSNSSTLALVKHVEKCYGDKIVDLCKYKDKAEFCAR